MTDNNDNKDAALAAEQSPKPEIVTQINATYDNTEDRIVLRATSNLNREFKLWITFKIFRLLMGAFDKIDNTAAPAHMPETSREAVKEFHREQSLKKANFTKNYKDDHLEPVFGDKPLLIDTIKVQMKNNAEVVIMTFCGEGKECGIPLTKDALTPTRHLLERAAAKGEWAPAPESVEATSLSENIPSDGKDKILH